jgi:hypothetical protein
MVERYKYMTPTWVEAYVTTAIDDVAIKCRAIQRRIALALRRLTASYIPALALTPSGSDTGDESTAEPAPVRI